MEAWLVEQYRAQKKVFRAGNGQADDISYYHYRPGLSHHAFVRDRIERGEECGGQCEDGPHERISYWK